MYQYYPACHAGPLKAVTGTARFSFSSRTQRSAPFLFYLFCGVSGLKLGVKRKSETRPTSTVSCAGTGLIWAKLVARAGSQARPPCRGARRGANWRPKAWPPPCQAQPSSGAAFGTGGTAVVRGRWRLDPQAGSLSRPSKPGLPFGGGELNGVKPDPPKKATPWSAFNRGDQLGSDGALRPVSQD